MDALALLRLYGEWGADTALDDTPIDWLARPCLLYTSPSPRD